MEEKGLNGGKSKKDQKPILIQFIPHGNINY